MLPTKNYVTKIRNLSDTKLNQKKKLWALMNKFEHFFDVRLVVARSYLTPWLLWLISNFGQSNLITEEKVI